MQSSSRANASTQGTRSGKVVNDGHRYDYLVEQFSEGAVGNLIFGSSSFRTDKLASFINERARMGYRLIFQVKEQRRLLGLFKRESIIMTFERAIS